MVEAACPLKSGPGALQAQHAALGKVGRGGLGEDASLAEMEDGAAEKGKRRGEDTGVAHADVVHHPSEAEQLLRLLLAQLRNLRRLPPEIGAYSLPRDRFRQNAVAELPTAVFV